MRDAAEDITFSVSSNCIERFDSGDMVFGMFAANILDAEVINDESEADGASLVGEETRGVWCRMVPEGSKVLDKTFVGGKDAGLWETIHAFSDLDEDITVLSEGSKVVMFHDIIRGVTNRDERGPPGMAEKGTKCMVLVQKGLPGIPWARRPISLEAPCSHRLACRGGQSSIRREQHRSNTPVSTSNICTSTG